MNCKKCGGCCKTLILPLGITVDDDSQKWLEYHGIKVIRGNPISYIEIDAVCSNLKDNQCSIYEQRPQVCRDYLCDKLKYAKERLQTDRRTSKYK